MGKTCCGSNQPCRSRKHPHRRGEDAILRSPPISSLETPPQAWGRRPHGVLKLRLDRNTPTGVGKTTTLLTPLASNRKHPHRRGEDNVAQRQCVFRQETPPQAWGRPHPFELPRSGAGNTPTGVGKTDVDNLARFPSWKHPHRRGEDFSYRQCRTSHEETPPQAWGRLICRNGVSTEQRNTPTGVGKTSRSLARIPRDWKHPHRRGEDISGKNLSCYVLETPPQAWGRLDVMRCGDKVTGNTPTGVGKTPCAQALPG